MKKIILLGIIALSFTIQAGYLESKAKMYFNNGDYEQAKTYLLKTIEEGEADDLGLVYYNLGLIYRYQQKYDESEKMYLKAIENGFVRAYSNLGVLYHIQKKYDRAEKMYLAAIVAGDKEMYNNLGSLYDNLNEYDKAEKVYLEGIKNGNTTLYYNFGNLYFKQGKYNKAKEMYLKVPRTQKIAPEAYYILGLIYTNENDFSNAKKYLKISSDLGNQNAQKIYREIVQNGY